MPLMGAIEAKAPAGKRQISCSLSLPSSPVVTGTHYVLSETRLTDLSINVVQGRKHSSRIQDIVHPLYPRLPVAKDIGIRNSQQEKS
jgi:hypothetical protein